MRWQGSASAVMQDGRVVHRVAGARRLPTRGRAGLARAAVSVFEEALRTVHPAMVAANRAQVASLEASNC